MKKTIIKNGFVVFTDPDEVKKSDILIENGIIIDIAENIILSDTEIINAENLYIFPGFIDIHAHFREPGFEYKETFETGLKAALKGGITTVVAMPNTQPVPDNIEIIKKIKNKTDKPFYPETIISASITQNRLGKSSVNYEILAKNGLTCFTDDGDPVSDSNIMFEALEASRKFNFVIMSHSQDKSIDKNNPLAEEVSVAREIAINSRASGNLHIQHISTALSLKYIEKARELGIKITCEVCPHHIFLSRKIKNYGIDTNFKMNPPLREDYDRKALIEGLKNGVINCIASDHAPHTAEEKSADYDKSPDGVSGIEIMVPLTVGKLFYEYGFSLPQISKLMSKNPAEIIFYKDRGVIKKGFKADFTIIDMNKKFILNTEDFISKGKNCAFNSFECYSSVEKTIKSGEVLYEV